MSKDKNTYRHVSYEQVKTIIDFMGQHIELATGSMRSLYERHTSKKLWGELTKTLNSCHGGTRKNSDGWSKYWSDFKNKLKNKVRILERQKSGSALNKTIRPLTKLEKRALVILGPYFDKRKNRKFEYTPVSDLQTEVKQETYHENNLSNNYGKDHNDTNDRLSGGENESEQSGASSDEDYVEEVQQVPNEQLIQNLYPKWLIEVEKKRADAELLRAKAEEQRASVAAINADAAVMQAEALNRLSEAAHKQAEAIMRIANILENRGCRDLLNI
ncbi:uncharacterized protein LOC115448401 isoform X1 [Manduca sexta]|uniref:uncharacterized protein LOC115448401 isoform X1 n=1 Tax=Manduca sexta TaxID=7130 RepID=UPI00188F8B02|nr:uncharacterized protein LOC115448401 isoform X1 [Manduca sexta]XP_030031680.2 uncharacterized protein LOC115448401 isoform X1 [Manduca sexta]